MPTESQSIGQRIAAYRRRRGLSQAAVAVLIGRSESWLSQVERGIHAVDKLSVLLDLAKVLLSVRDCARKEGPLSGQFG